MDYAPGGGRLALGVATASPEGGPPLAQRIVMLHAGAGRLLWQHAMPMEPGQWEPHVRFVSDRRLVSSAQRGRTSVWDAATGRRERDFPFGGRLAVAPGGGSVALALNSSWPGEGISKVRLLDLRTGEKADLAEDLWAEWVLALEFTEDGERLATATVNGTVVWDLATGTVVERFGRRVGDARARTAGGGAVVVPAGGGAVAVWDVGGARRLGRRFEWAPNTFSCNSNPCAVTSPAQDLMATTSGDGRVAIVELETGALRWMVPARNGEPAEGLAFTTDGRLATGGFAGTVTIWDLDRRAVARRLRYGGQVHKTAVSPDGTLLAATVGSEGEDGVRLVVRELPSEQVRYTRDLAERPGRSRLQRRRRRVVANGCCTGGSLLAAWDARTGRSGSSGGRRTSGRRSPCTPIPAGCSWATRTAASPSGTSRAASRSARR